MNMTGERRRRLWRWAVIVWALAVAVGGGLTLLMRDSMEHRAPYTWEQADPGETPARPPDAPGCPGDDETDEPVAIACVYVEAD